MPMTGTIAISWILQILVSCTLGDYSWEMKLSVPNSATQGVLLTDLRTFALTVELGSLANAARALRLSKTSVTRQLGRLEEALGQRLLHRGGGRFALTEEGRDLLLRVRAPVSAIDEAVTSLTDADGRLEGRLRIAAPYTFGRTVIAPVLPSFMALHPAVIVDLDLSSRKVDLLADEADIAVRVGDPGSDQLVARCLRRDRVILCAAPTYLSARPPINALPDLSLHSLLDFRPNTTLGGFEVADSAGVMTPIIPAKVTLRCNEPEVLAMAARNGVGIAVIPESFVKQSLEDGSLEVVLAGCGLLARDINALYAPGRRQSPKIRAFLDHLISHLDRVA